MRRARWGPTAMTWRRFQEATDPEQYAKAWAIENPRWRRRLRINGRGHQICLWETISWTGCIAEVLEVRDGLGFRLAWAGLFHTRHEDEPVTIAKEFFVWPWVRRQGYGRLLLEWAEERAIAFRSPRVLILFHDFDAIVPARTAGRRFLQRAGYHLRWRPHDFEHVAAVGSKTMARVGPWRHSPISCARTASGAASPCVRGPRGPWRDRQDIVMTSLPSVCSFAKSCSACAASPSG
jgi:GNAT superfamily N-acetyltransferase